MLRGNWPVPPYIPESIRSRGNIHVFQIAFFARCSAGELSTLFFAAGVQAQGQANTQAGLGAAGEIENVVITGLLEQDLPQRLAELGTRVDVVNSAEIKNGGCIQVSQDLQRRCPCPCLSPMNSPSE